MILEKDKVYKVKHVVYGTKRNYVIFSPINDIVLPEDFFDKIYGGYHFDIYCHFIICFDSSIKTEFDLCLGLPQTGIYRDCTILELNGKDIQEIKKVIEKMGNTYKYNRKLNKLIYGNK